MLCALTEQRRKVGDLTGGMEDHHPSSFPREVCGHVLPSLGAGAELQCSQGHLLALWECDGDADKYLNVKECAVESAVPSKGHR